MKITHTPESLRAFEEEIASLFNAGKIRAPVHLEGGSEPYLIPIFEAVEEEDWVLCSWRSHLKCLLKGVPEEELKRAILAGKSISLCFPKYRILSSAIVGGICPIAVGLALSLQKKKSPNKIIVFCGDMTAHTGIFYECQKYAKHFDLPIWWVLEDNGVSTNTPTVETWKSFPEPSKNTIAYYYHNVYPHQGTGKWVEF